MGRNTQDSTIAVLMLSVGSAIGLPIGTGKKQKSAQLPAFISGAALDCADSLPPNLRSLVM
jgi:hypothetical protein